MADTSTDRLGSLTWPGLLGRLLAGTDLGADDTAWVMDRVLSGEATAAQLAGFLVALRAKGEAADEVAGLAAADAGQVDLAILDGEAQPTGGMGVSRQLKNEIDDCPPIIVTVRRRDDRWLATWSQADAVLVHPLDPLTAAETVASVLRRAQAEAADDDVSGAPAIERH